ncbi:HAD-IIB family hydrolase [Kitasatospora sp. GP82]|uniref:HAD-IIB family hydrolase n=1 Tax=Kitasatospora sp. GP82 TaxID=3035089 RepID=UPI002474B050|nr:HAD-IIB family hydrolase [Kitasatospora sp. GP82]MDH6126446.1 trehalose-6-phosphate synthase/hydroxymethylpyrimidine pyrophosphatase-like HAD family hydrolase [Kitasatospora sp. GP82]
MRILVADLDGTLLGADVTARRRLRDALDRHPEVMVVFATGRGLPSVREALEDQLLPRPRWIIADVGASVLDGVDHAPVEALQSELRRGWPGAERVRAELGRFPRLTYQDGVSQDGRCSFFVRPHDLTSAVTEAVEALGCAWVYSADRYFDVLPRGVSKGTALAALARRQGWSPASILVAGDSLNDLSMFQLGTHGVAVGNSEPALIEALAGQEAVHRPEQPGAAGVLRALLDLGWVKADSPLVIGYHRPPVNWTPEGGWREPSSPNGILPTLRSLFGGGLDATWVAAAVLEQEEHAARLDGHGTKIPLSFLRLLPAEWRAYFHQACKEALWPVLMSQPERLHFDPSAWEQYRAVNERFAERIAGEAGPGGTVWLHDYNLWLVPGVLRKTRPDLRVGLFHHTPFPPPEVFAALPTADEVRASLGCLDWAGFHTETFADHFRSVLADTAEPPRIGVHPLGIDRDAIEALARHRAHRAPRARKRSGQLVLSVERLDYTKAPVEKVEAVAALLARRPELRGRLRLRLVCAPPEPGITAYDATRQELEQRVAEVNRRWGRDGWQPIDYLPRSLSFAEVIDNYLAADVLWVTSLQDGMNLTAKEFIAAQAAVGLPGALVLSRHAGAADELGEAAVLTDPYDLDDLAEKLAQALALTPAERRHRLAALAGRLGHRHPTAWAAEIIAAIQGLGSTS